MNDNIRVDHINFDLFKEKMEIFSTRKGGIVKLVDILDEAWADAKKEIKKIIVE